MKPSTADGTTFIRGLAVGVLLGGGTALIFTPRTGEELREWVGEMAHMLGERVRGALTGEASAVVSDREPHALTSQS